MLYRHEELLKCNYDLTEKIRKLELIESYNDNSKNFNLNEDFNQGFNLEYLALDNNEREDLNLQMENKENYTINMRVNVKKPCLGVSNSNVNKDMEIREKRKKTLMEITEIMHHKPFGKV